MIYITELKDHFKKSEDVKFKENNEYSLIYCEGLCDVKEIENEILGKIYRHLLLDPKNITSAVLTINPIKTIDYSTIDELIFSGFCLFYYQQTYYSINVINVPKRTPDQSIIDITITGPRDSFIENIETNVALVRKRLKTSELNYQKFTLGKNTKTQIGLLYMKNKCEPKIIQKLTNQLKQLSETDITSSGQFRSLLYGKQKRLFPHMTYTTRPDYCTLSLLKGQFVIFIDNFNNANIGPATLSLFIDYSDDINDHFITTFLNRSLYFFCGFISIFLMGFIIAIYCYHPQELPILWLSNILSIQKGMVLPVYLEIIFATLLFELFLVAGTRLPAGISSTLLVIGSVLLGQNVISSGFIGYDIMFLSAFNIICNYSVSNNISFNSVITVLKIIVFIASATLGLYGFILSFVGITLYLSSLKSFDKDMINPYLVLNFKTFSQLFKSVNFKKKVKSS